MNGRYCIWCCTVLCCGIVSFVSGSSCCERFCDVLWRDEEIEKDNLTCAVDVKDKEKGNACNVEKKVVDLNEIYNENLNEVYDKKKIGELISKNDIKDKTKWFRCDKITMEDAEKTKKENPGKWICVIEEHRPEDDMLKYNGFAFPYNMDFSELWRCIKINFIKNGVGFSKNDRLLLFVQGKIDNVVGGSRFGFDDKISDVFEQYKNKKNGILHISYAVVER
ncbi:MAG: hypothetical protein II393_01120 [Cytophagales bacterium]|nr:hypothetical protein [Cytophagales bacterium]